MLYAKLITRLSILSLFLAAFPTFAQSVNQTLEQSFNNGMEALRRSDYELAIGKFSQAINEKPEMIKAHYYLGLSLFKLERYQEALTAYQRLLEVDRDNVSAHYQIGKIQIKLNNQEAAKEEYRWLKEQAEGASTAPDDRDDKLVDDKPKDPARPLGRKQREYAGELAVYLSALISPEQLNNEVLDNPAQNATVNSAPSTVLPMNANLKPTILYKEKAKYTEIARLNNQQGTVVVNVVFTVEGRITGIKVIRGLPDGLSECAIRAAQKIRFQPAMKDGMPVSVRGNLEFTFNLY